MVRFFVSVAWPLWMALLLAQVALSFFLYQSEGNRTLQAVGWLVGWSAGVLGVLPILTLRQKGAVPNGAPSYTYTSRLVDSGIYAVVRHPQYLSFMLLSLFLALVVQHWWVWATGIAAMAVVYTGIVPQEDRSNIEKFGDGYRTYMQTVPAVNFVVGVIRLLRRRMTGGKGDVRT